MCGFIVMRWSLGVKAEQVRNRAIQFSSAIPRHGPPSLRRVRIITPFPDVTARMPLSDSLLSWATDLVSLAGGFPRYRRFFCADEADDTFARQRVVRRRRVTGSPQNQDGSRRGEGLPGSWAFLFVRAMIEHLTGYVPLLARHTERPLRPSSNSASWYQGRR
jgi:hypothetical protein